MEIDFDRQHDQIKRVKEKLKKDGIFNHPDLDVVCMCGSNTSDSGGELSDIDITTVMKTENPKRVDLRAIVELGLQIRKFAFQESLSGNVVPIVISTIRLEEAQVALAEASNPNKLIIPIHWLHYPSFEFAAINEPPKLVEGLLSGHFLLGNKDNVLEKFRKIDRQQFGCLAGLDWLTDSFRVLLANINNGEFPINRQPDSFLKKLALHNLEYFWKWNIIRKIIEKKTGRSPDSWKTMEQLSSFIPDDLWKLSSQVRELRHNGPWVSVEEIIELHTETFNVLSNLNGSN